MKSKKVPATANPFFSFHLCRAGKNYLTSVIFFVSKCPLNRNR